MLDGALCSSPDSSSARGGAESQESASQLRRGAHIGVVVVEDDATLRQSMEEFLALEGYEPQAVSTLREARRLIAEQNPCVLVLDLTLDGEFGADLLIDLADAEEAPATVIVSAFSLAQLVGDRFGVEVVRKPFELDALLDAVARAAGQGRRPRAPIGGQ